MDAPYILRALNKIYSSLSGIDLYRNIQIKQLAGFSYYDLTRWAIEFIDSLEDNRILSTFALMEEYKCKGYNIVIASATIDPIAKAIANKLSVEYYSSKLSYSNNMCSGKLEKDLLLQKKVMLSKLLDNVEVAIVVTDNFTDIELVKMCDHCHIIVHNDKNIRKWSKLLNNNISKIDFIKKNV
ncbi:haloacid dehalogenase-like hydrolase [Escherichia coli]|nr:haloacid dehalogenase-like hydrolase [Escherichia coli]EEW6057389.1 haloacid dehalogenase-like hydrolase [Escherichia coli]PAQ55585.1 haloacid dehalogenase-like hydrolase [Escherichia coli]